MENKIIIDHLELYPTIVHRPMDWYEAESIIERLGPEWRLPTIAEFQGTLQPHRSDYPALMDDSQYYWSSDSRLRGDAEIFSFMAGRPYSMRKNGGIFYVLPVRDFTDKDAVEYLLKEF